MTADLLALADWLAAAGCTHVAMESTGVYWKPLYNLLEDQFTLLLVNPKLVVFVDRVTADRPHTLDLAAHFAGAWRGVTGEAATLPSKHSSRKRSSPTI